MVNVPQPDLDWDFISFCFQKYTVNFNKSTGIIEMFMDSLEVTDEGTFTFNLVDGKAKGTTSLVLIGDGKTSNVPFFFNSLSIWIERQI